MDSLDAPCCFQQENKNKKWGVLGQPLSQWVIGENFCRLGLLTAPDSTLAVIHVLKLQANSSTSPSPNHWFQHGNTTRIFSFPFDPFCYEPYARGPRPVWVMVWLPFHQKRSQKENCWCLPRLARLRVRTPSAVVLSPPMEEVFSTAFMFSCSAASSAYCSPWGWLWQGGELLENLPDCRRKTDLLF